MGVSKVNFGERTLIDISNDTVTPETLARGYTAHDASGELIEGIMNPIGSIGLEYTPITSSGVTYAYKVSKGTCTDAEIVIPSYYDGKPVSYIGDFSNLINLKSIVLPLTVAEITTDAFKSCTNLKYITNPIDATSIGSGAFTDTAIEEFYFKYITVMGKAPFPDGARVYFSQSSPHSHWDEEWDSNNISVTWDVPVSYKEIKSEFDAVNAEIEEIKSEFDGVNTEIEGIKDAIKGKEELKVGILDGTTWRLNDNIPLDSTMTYAVDFVSNGSAYNKLIINSTVGVDGSTLQKISYGKAINIVYNNGIWDNTNYQYVTFTGGTDSTNLDLIDLLYEIGSLLSVNLSQLQPKVDERLNTEDKEIVGAINEVNEKVLSKKAIIDVVALPTSNINKESFYQLVEAKWYCYGDPAENFTCHCVATLPENPEPITSDMVSIVTYFSLDSRLVYGYVDEMISAYFNANFGVEIPVGWHDVARLFELVELVFDGFVTNPSQSIDNPNMVLLVQHTLYTYNQLGWSPLKSIGIKGEADYAEIFNDPANVARGEYSHAQGKLTFAQGWCSHAQGLETVARGAVSTAEGFNTVAEGNSSHVQGKNNIIDYEDKYAHIVGNGTGDSERSNAHTIDWQGNGWFAGDIKVGGTGQDDPNAKKLATTEYVDSKLGGDSAQSLIGTWTVIDSPEIPTSDLPLEFTSNGVNYVAIGYTSQGPSFWGINALSYQAPEGYYDTAYVNNPSGSYGITHGWSNEAYKTITVTAEPTDANAIAWLGNNTDAPKVTPPKDNGFEMPQIRFTSATGSTENESPMFYVDADNPLKLTVEIVGGGALQVGDQLQVCVRKRFNGSTSNGFRRKYKLQRFAEYVVTEDDLDKQYLTVQISFTEPRGKAFRGLFRDGMANGLAPLYLRIRRPKGVIQNNDSGQTVDAFFSNIVTIKKHSIRGAQSIRIQ